MSYFKLSNFGKFQHNSLTFHGRFRFLVVMHRFNNYQGWRGHWTVNYTGTQKLLTMLCYLLVQKLQVLLSIFDWLGQNNQCPNFLTLIFIYKIVYHYWVCISIYRTKSYPLRSLIQYSLPLLVKLEIKVEYFFVKTYFEVH